MTLTLELPAPLERRLADQAKATGKSVEAVAVEWLARGSLPGPTFAEISADVGTEFEASGMTEDELDALIEEARQEHWEETQRRARGDA